MGIRVRPNAGQKIWNVVQSWTKSKFKEHFGVQKRQVLESLDFPGKSKKTGGLKPETAKKVLEHFNQHHGLGLSYQDDFYDYPPKASNPRGLITWITPFKASPSPSSPPLKVQGTELIVIKPPPGPETVEPYDCETDDDDVIDGDSEPSSGLGKTRLLSKRKILLAVLAIAIVACIVQQQLSRPDKSQNSLAASSLATIFSNRDNQLYINETFVPLGTPMPTGEVSVTKLLDEIERLRKAKKLPSSGDFELDAQEIARIISDIYPKKISISNPQVRFCSAKLLLHFNSPSAAIHLLEYHGKTSFPSKVDEYLYRQLQASAYAACYTKNPPRRSALENAIKINFELIDFPEPIGYQRIKTLKSLANNLDLAARAGMIHEELAAMMSCKFTCLAAIESLKHAGSQDDERFATIQLIELNTYLGGMAKSSHFDPAIASRIRKLATGNVNESNLDPSHRLDFMDNRSAYFDLPIAGRIRELVTERVKKSNLDPVHKFDFAVDNILSLLPPLIPHKSSTVTDFLGVEKARKLFESDVRPLSQTDFRPFIACVADVLEGFIIEGEFAIQLLTNTVDLPKAEDQICQLDRQIEKWEEKQSAPVEWIAELHVVRAHLQVGIIKFSKTKDRADAREKAKHLISESLISFAAKGVPDYLRARLHCLEALRLQELGDANVRESDVGDFLNYSLELLEQLENQPHYANVVLANAIEVFENYHLKHPKAHLETKLILEMQAAKLRLKSPAAILSFETQRFDLQVGTVEENRNQLLAALNELAALLHRRP